MADDVLIRDANSTLVPVATRDKAGREVQLVQLDIGDGSTIAPVEGALPVAVPGALPLPTGAATAANQSATNAALGGASDAEAAGDGSAIAILKRIRTLTGGSQSALGTQADAEATGNGSITAILKRIRTLLGGILTVRGTRLNDGTDVAAGASHLTVGGSDGANLRPLLLDSQGRAVVASSALGASSDARATDDTGDWSLVALTKRLLSKFTPVSLPDGNAVMPVTGVMKKWIDDFGGAALDTSLWDAFDGGVYPGGSAGVEANGSGIPMGTPTITNSTLVMAMGTTPLAEFHLLSKATFTIPVDVWVAIQQSQAIANNTVNIELVEVDPVTGWPIGHATIAGECRNRGGAVITGTTATTYTLEATADDSPNGVNSVNGTGGANWQSVASDVSVEFRPVAMWISAIATDGTGGRSGMARLSRQLPDPNKLYKLRIRWRNGAVAPASSTTTTLFRVVVMDVQEMSVEVTSGRGDSAVGRAVPVVSVSGSIIQGSSADNGTTPGNPVMAGVLMTSAAGGPVAGTTLRLGSIQGDLARRQVIIGQGTPQSHVSARLAAQTGATEVTLLAAQGATLRSVLQTITIVNHDTAVLVLDIRDALAGTIRETVRLAASTTMQLTFPNGRPAAALNTAWTVQARSATTTAGWDVAASFYVTTA